jgi:hypothetical protein
MLNVEGSWGIVPPPTVSGLLMNLFFMARFSHGGVGHPPLKSEIRVPEIRRENMEANGHGFSRIDWLVDGLLALKAR